MKNPLRKYALICIGILTVSAFQIPDQDNDLFRRILHKLVLYNNNEGPEKTYLHTDKDLYTNGETIWFKSYLVDGISHRQSGKSKVVYVELVDGGDSVVAQRKLYVDALGAHGDIKIGDDLPQGDYTLRSYTKYMLNEKEPVYFQKKVPIFVQTLRANASADQPPNSRSLKGFSTTGTTTSAIYGSPKISFYPEGGHLVEGLSGTMGLEVTDQKGNGIALKGDIRDSQGMAVAAFESHEFGLGSVIFTPRPGKRYYASVIIDGQEKEFPLPTPLATGYSLSLKNRGDNILVQVSTNTDDGLEGTMLIGHLRGNPIFDRIGRPEDGDTYAVKILTKELLDGVAQFTLFAPDGQPVCERLVFVDDPDNDVGLSITSNTKKYGTREKVSLDVALTDAIGAPLKGEFSMGVVTRSNRIDEDAPAPDIRSWMLLDSDLGGTLEDPGYFFRDASDDTRLLLDALMLTHGWRRFVWADMLDKKVGRTMAYPPEKGIMITGKTTAFNNPYAAKKSFASFSVLGKEVIHEQKMTNEQGEFAFGPFVFVDSISGVIQASDTLEKRKDRQHNYSVFLDPPAPVVNFKHKKWQESGRQTVALAQEYLKESYRKKVTDFEYDPKVTQLNEVVVQSKKKSRIDFINKRMDIINQEMHAEATTGPFSNRVFRDSIPGGNTMSALDLIRRVPGVQVSGEYLYQIVRVRGFASVNASNSPLFLMDGIAIGIEAVQTMRANEVMFIDVVKGPDASLFGSRGAPGVIAVYTDRGFSFETPNEIVPGITNFEVDGFYKVREFYAPDYAKSGNEQLKPDYRTTLFWDPSIRIGAYGKSSLEFYTGDSPSSYWVKVEGMTSDGVPVKGVYDFEVEQSY